MTHSRKTKSVRPISAVAPQRRQAPIPARPKTPPQETPLIIWAVLVVAAISIQAIVLAFTPLTYLLDEIKVAMFFIAGPALMVMAAAAIAMRQAPWPSRSIGLGLLSYFIVLALSTLASAYHYIGWFTIVFNWSALGFFMAAFVVGAHRRPSYVFIRFLAVMLLVEVLIGFFLYDPTGSIEHHSGIGLLKKFLYGNAKGGDSLFQNLVLTLASADDTLQSTILNREFFADFCCLLVPFAYLLAICPGPSRYPRAWRITGVVTAILATLAIFGCQSKGEWIMWIIGILFLAVMLFKIGYFNPRKLTSHHIHAWLIGMVLLTLALGWMRSPTVFSVLHKTQISLESREIIWKGAWKIFKENPHNMVVGSGPGTFRIYFTAHRAPDYYQHGINNVTTLTHNYFMDILCETGLLGVVTFGIFLAGLIGLSLREILRCKDTDLRLWLLFTMTAVLLMYGGNMTSPSGRWVIGATPFWTVEGLLAGLIYQSQKQK